MSDLTALLVAGVLLAMNAFFVGAEFALVSARRTQIEPRAAEGSRLARTTLRAIENVSLMMAGAQLGITICSLGLGALGEPAVAHLIEPAFEALGMPAQLLHPVAFVIAMSIVVYLHVVIGEMVPKNLAIAGPERAALVLGPPMVAIVMVLKPLVVALNMIANGTLRLMRVEPKGEVESAFTREQVAGMVDESRGEGLLGPRSYELLAKTLGFTERTVASALLPIDKVATVPRGGTLADVERRCVETGFSRFPVTGGADLVGYIHIKDILDTEPERLDHVKLDKWIHPMATLRPTSLLHDAFITLQKRGTHLGRVVDDDGNPLGVVALEDVIEELVGEIRDAGQKATSADVGDSGPGR